LQGTVCMTGLCQKSILEILQNNISE
jgi:hypothetical protein